MRLVSKPDPTPSASPLELCLGIPCQGVRSTTRFRRGERAVLRRSTVMIPGRYVNAVWQSPKRPGKRRRIRSIRTLWRGHPDPDRDLAHWRHCEQAGWQPFTHSTCPESTPRFRRGRRRSASRATREDPRSTVQTGPRGPTRSGQFEAVFRIPTIHTSRSTAHRPLPTAHAPLQFFWIGALILAGGRKRDGPVSDRTSFSPVLPLFAGRSHARHINGLPGGVRSK